MQQEVRGDEDNTLPCSSFTIAMRRTNGRWASGLHKKGLLTLALVLLAESVSFSNAVSFYKTYQSYTDWGGRGDNSEHESPFTQAAREAAQVKECTSITNTATDSCANSAKSQSGQRMQPVSPPFYSRASRLSKHKRLSVAKNVNDCSECFQEADPVQLSKLCTSIDIPRGGQTTLMKEAAETVAAAAASLASSNATPYGIPLNGWKILFQAFLTTLNVLCWLIPLRSKRMTENKLALGLANAFSGGVFLSLAFGHLIPECVHGFEGFNEAMPFMIVLGGYLLIFFVEKVAFDAHGALEDMENGHQKNGAVDKPGNNGDTAHGHSKTSRSAVILLGALAVHSILEMTALGLADTFGDSALLTLSIALHQPAESIALLVAFLKSGMPKNEIIKFLSIFSACGPIGVAVGMAVNEFAAPIVDSIFLAIVAGTFVYVGATEVIPEEWEDSEHKWKKFGALMAGIVSIFMITQYTMTLEGMVS